MAPRRAPASTGTEPETPTASAVHAAPSAIARLRVAAGGLSALAIYWGRTRFELDGILRSFLTVIFIVLPILAVFPILIFGVTSETDTQTLLPVSAIVV